MKDVARGSAAVPLQMTIRGIGDATTVESTIRRRADRLLRYCDRILRCHVTVTSPQRRNGVGRLYNVDILIHVPGEDLIVARDEADLEALKAALSVRTAG